MTGQKDHPHQEEILHQVLIKPKAPAHQKNITVKAPSKNDLFRRQEKAVMISRRAALAAARAKRKHSPEKAGHTAAGHQMVNHRARKKHLHLKAGPIQAEPPIMTQGREKALAVKEQEIKNRLHRAANHQRVHLMPMINLKEALAAKEQVIKNLLHRGANQQDHLMLMRNQKEVLEVIKNLATDRRAVVLKDRPVTVLMTPISHIAQNHVMIK